MPLTLTAPISEDDYKNFPSLKLPDDFTGDKMTALLNKAWAFLTNIAQQPLSQTTATDVHEFGGRYCNVRPDGSLIILPKNTPLISVTSVSYSLSPANFGWTALTVFDAFGSRVILTSSPFYRGNSGFVQLVYSCGYAIVPDDLKLACALTAAHLISGGYFPTEGGGGEGSVLPLWLPRDVQEIVNDYKRVR